MFLLRLIVLPICFQLQMLASLICIINCIEICNEIEHKREKLIKSPVRGRDKGKRLTRYWRHACKRKQCPGSTRLSRAFECAFACIEISLRNVWLTTLAHPPINYFALFRSSIKTLLTAMKVITSFAITSQQQTPTQKLCNFPIDH